MHAVEGALLQSVSVDILYKPASKMTSCASSLEPPLLTNTPKNAQMQCRCPIDIPFTLPQSSSLEPLLPLHTIRPDP